MAVDGSLAGRVRAMGLVLVDALGYALVVTLVTTVAASVVGIATGGGFVRVKTLLFLAGFLLMAYATVRLWPSSPRDLEGGTDARTRGDGSRNAVALASEPTRFQSFVRTVPPIRWTPLPPPDRRLSPPVKLFLGSLFVLLTSFLMETAFGVT